MLLKCISTFKLNLYFTIRGIYQWKKGGGLKTRRDKGQSLLKIANHFKIHHSSRQETKQNKTTNSVVVSMNRRKAYSCNSICSYTTQFKYTRQYALNKWGKMKWNEMKSCTWKISKGDTDASKNSCLHPWSKSELLQVGQALLILI